MPRDITDVSTFTDPALTVSSGDSASAANMLDVLQPLANRTRYLKDELAASLQLINIVNYGGVGDGATDNTTAFIAASTAASSDPSRIIYMPAGTYELASTQALTANLKFAPGATLKPASGQTITITGLIDANPRQQIFDLSLGGLVAPTADKIFHVGWWGAKFDSTTDDAAAIQSAVDSLPNAVDPTFFSGVVSCPPGNAKISKPIHLNKNGMKFTGQGYESTTLSGGTNFTGPLLVMSPDYDPIPTVAGILGTGVSMQMDPTTSTPYYVNLQDSPFMNLDGLSALTIELYIKIDPSAVGTGGVILDSIGSVHTGVAGDAAYKFVLDPNGSDFVLDVELGTTAGNLGSTCPTHLSASTLYHIACTYDGSTAKWYINGTLDYSQAGSGTVAQPATCNALLGFTTGSWPEVGNAGPFAGAIDSVRFSNAVMYPSNFTPTYAKLAKTNNTLLLLNFDNFYKMHVIGQCADIVDNPATTLSCYLPRRAGGNLVFLSNLQGCHFKDFTLQGFFRNNPFYAANCQDSIWENIHAQNMTNGFLFYYNCYQASVRKLNIEVVGNNASPSHQAKGQYGFSFAISGITSVIDCVAAGAMCGLVGDETGLSIRTFGFFSTAAAQYGLILRNSSYTVDSFELDNEAVSGIWNAGILLDACQAVSITGGTIDVSSASNSGACCFDISSTSAVYGTNSVSISGCNLLPGTGGTVCKFTGAQVSPVVFNGSGRYGGNATAAFGDANGTPKVDGCVARRITSGTSSTANRFDEIIGVNVGTAYDLTAPPNPVAGQPLVVKDQSGAAATNNITITANSGQTIDGGTTYIINIPRQSITLVYDGISDWMVI